MKLFTFKGGIHPPEYKALTENKAIEEFKPSKMIYIPLLQHIGVILDPLVKVGEYVKKGQKIGDSKGFLSAPVHSSVSGTVKKIEMHPFPVSGRVMTVIIENDFKEEEELYETHSDYGALSKDELLKLIRERGVVGQGGATFPTHIKLNPPKDKVIDTLLINGAECEPYLNADNRLMLEQTDKMVMGIDIIRHTLGIKSTFIGIEENKPEAIAKMQEACKKYDGMEVAVLKTQYPQGGEKQLIKAIMDRDVPSGKLPAEVGVVVQNTATALSIYEAIVEGKPVIEKVMTISGAGIQEPKNIKVKVGTQFNEILEFCGINRDVTEKLVMGGPMMGLAQYSEDKPVIKGTSGLLALTKKEMRPYKSRACITCGKCVDVCPMNLSPLMYAKYARFEKWDELKKYDLMDCIECGTCSYICPANRPLTEGIKIGKAKLRSMKK